MGLNSEQRLYRRPLVGPEVVGKITVMCGGGLVGKPMQHAWCTCGAERKCALADILSDSVVLSSLPVSLLHIVATVQFPVCMVSK